MHVHIVFTVLASLISLGNSDQFASSITTLSRSRIACTSVKNPLSCEKLKGCFWNDQHQLCLTALVSDECDIDEISTQLPSSAIRSSLCEGRELCEFNRDLNQCTDDRLNSCPRRFTKDECANTPGCSWVFGLGECFAHSRGSERLVCALFDDRDMCSDPEVATACVWDEIAQVCEVRPKTDFLPASYFQFCTEFPSEAGCARGLPIPEALCPVQFTPEMCGAFPECKMDEYTKTCTARFKTPEQTGENTFASYKWIVAVTILVTVTVSGIVLALKIRHARN